MADSAITIRAPIRAIMEEYLSAHNSDIYTEILNYLLNSKRKAIRESYMNGLTDYQTKLHMACALKNKTTGVTG